MVHCRMRRIKVHTDCDPSASAALRALAELGIVTYEMHVSPADYPYLLEELKNPMVTLVVDPELPQCGWHLSRLEDGTEVSRVWSPGA